MLKEEFEKRAGRKVSQEFYTEVVEPMYYAYEGDKDEFSKDFATCFGRMSDDRIGRIKNLTQSWFVMNDKVVQEKLAEKQNLIDGMVDAIITTAFKGSYEVRKACVAAIGWEAYLYRKAKAGYALAYDEVALLRRMLNLGELDDDTTHALPDYSAE